MDEIEIVPYDARWPALYEAERMRLLPVLDRFRLIEMAHIGSTAVSACREARHRHRDNRGVSRRGARARGPEYRGIRLSVLGRKPGATISFSSRASPPTDRRIHHLHVTIRILCFSAVLRTELKTHNCLF